MRTHHASYRFYAILLIGLFTIITIAQENPSQNFVGIGIRSVTNENWQTYRVETGEIFTGNLWLSNQQEGTTYLLTCILNYQQVPCGWNNTEESILYRVELADFEEVTISFTTPPISDAFNDFMILAFANPFSEDVSFNYRLSTDLALLYRSRIILVAQDDVTPPSDLSFDHMGELPEPESIGFFGLIINRIESRSELQAWTVETSGSDESIDYFVHLGNNVPNNSTDTTANIMAFLNYEQIPISDDSQTLMVDLPANSQLTLPASFVAPSQPGTYELNVVATYSPYQYLETPQSGTDRESTQIITNVDPSIRVAIVVE